MGRGVWVGVRIRIRIRVEVRASDRPLMTANGREQLDLAMLTLTLSARFLPWFGVDATVAQEPCQNGRGVAA